LALTMRYLTPALLPTPAPEPVGDPATRDMVVAACHRAGCR
jgi:hypothetical protein